VIVDAGEQRLDDVWQSSSSRRRRWLLRRRTAAAATENPLEARHGTARHGPARPGTAPAGSGRTLPCRAASGQCVQPCTAVCSSRHSAPRLITAVYLSLASVCLLTLRMPVVGRSNSGKKSARVYSLDSRLRFWPRPQLRAFGLIHHHCFLLPLKLSVVSIL